MSGAVVWITGLPAAGKTTLAEAVASELRSAGRATLIIDGDRLRAGLSRDLGFSPAERAEQVRRAAELARLAAEQGQVVLVALVSPSCAERTAARACVAPLPFIEVHLDAAAALCQARDPKGLWAAAAAGRLRGLTGYDAAYEAPTAPELRLPAHAALRQNCQLVMVAITTHGHISPT